MSSSSRIQLLWKLNLKSFWFYTIHGLKSNNNNSKFYIKHYEIKHLAAIVVFIIFYTLCVCVCVCMLFHIQYIYWLICEQVDQILFFLYIKLAGAWSQWQCSPSPVKIFFNIFFLTVRKGRCNCPDGTKLPAKPECKQCAWRPASNLDTQLSATATIHIVCLNPDQFIQHFSNTTFFYYTIFQSVHSFFSESYIIYLFAKKIIYTNHHRHNYHNIIVWRLADPHISHILHSWLIIFFSVLFLTS